MFSANADSERASSVKDYQSTCTDFIIDIGKDYDEWVDRYQLDESERENRKSAIQDIQKRTNAWICKYGDTFKKIDIIMNDGINKMAESTAGYPFSLSVTVNSMNRYIDHPIGQVKLNVTATPRFGRYARIGNYHGDQLFLINSVCQVDFTVSHESLKGGDILNDYVIVNTMSCGRYDLISITIVVEELSELQVVTERRGYTTIIVVS